MKQPKNSIWATTREDLTETNAGSKGVLIITWKDVPDERIQSLISNIYSENRDTVEGMVYREYVPEMNEKVSQIFSFVEGKLEEKKEKGKQVTLF